MRKVYKAVKMDGDGRLVSVVVTLPGWRRVYRSTRGARRLVSRAFAFGSRRSAESFAAKGTADYQLWEAECESARAIRLVADWDRPQAMSSFRQHDGYRNSWSRGSTFRAPPGTLYCKNLRLVKRLDA